MYTHTYLNIMTINHFYKKNISWRNPPKYYRNILQRTFFHNKSITYTILLYPVNRLILECFSENTPDTIRVLLLDYISQGGDVEVKNRFLFSALTYFSFVLLHFFIVFFTDFFFPLCCGYY